MTWTYKTKVGASAQQASYEELDVKTVTLKCLGCGAKIKVHLMEGECTSETIIGCEKCTKKLNHWEEWNESRKD